MAQSVKEEIIEFIKNLPDDISYEDVIYHLYIKETILQRKTELDSTVTPIPHEQVQEQIEKWLQ